MKKNEPTLPSPSPDTLIPIGMVRSCWTEKFGIPKQPGLVTAATAVIELLPPYDREEMFRGLEEFSHIWVIFLFHSTLAEGWKPTVRPPRLGGQKRVGVFASRSPHRPNHLGMSAVRLEEVVSAEGSVRLLVSGVDLLDSTPVLDIKPYVPYADRIVEAGDGFTVMEIPEASVLFSPTAERFCRGYRQRTGRDLELLVRQTLRQDPRPASQRSVGREYGTLFWNVNVRWRVMPAGFEVLGCEEIRERWNP